MKKIVVGVTLAIATFAALGGATGVLGMLDLDYCVRHPHRPPRTQAHEERLSLVPPGPECRFMLESGETVVEGPGWTPALVALASIATPVLVLGRVAS